MFRLVTLCCAFVASFATPVLADSCWDHNGSVMRLTANGNGRAFLYENPRQGLWGTGVQVGTWLFSGQNNGDYYSGTARVFSSSCPHAPLEYWVEGPVSHNPLRVTMYGSREVYQNCAPTGRWADDTLVFTFLYNC